MCVCPIKVKMSTITIEFSPTKHFPNKLKILVNPILTFASTKPHLLLHNLRGMRSMTDV